MDCRWSRSDYTEFNLNIEYGAELGEKVEIDIGYSHIQARDNGVNSNDNELGFDLSFEVKDRLHLASSVYYSFEAQGSFVELAVEHEYPVNEKWHLGLQGIIGINAGYVSDGHDGLNHFQILANVTYHPIARAEMHAYIAYNKAIDEDSMRYSGDELLDDFVWGGIGLTYSF